MTFPYFRPGVGTIIYNEHGEILVFRRTDNPDLWQLQQGGQDHEETVLETLWRELAEETGLVASDFSQLNEYPNWTIYEYPEEVKRRITPGCLGQVHRWFFLALRPAVTVDLARASDREFDAFKWTTFPVLLQNTGPMKYPVYAQLAAFFAQTVATTAPKAQDPLPHQS
jgi:putative (di)nucleoside polyphosphate hydrolase